MPLLEIVRGEQTDDATLATAFAVGKALKKSCVLVKDAPGVRRQPAADPVPRRGHRGRRRGHADRGRRPGAGAARPADAAVRAAAAGRPGRRAARRRDDARGLPGPLRRVGEPATLVAAGKPASTSGPRASRWSTRRSPSCSQTGDHRADRGRGAGAGARRARRGDPAHARRGRGRRRRRTSTCA